MKMTIDEKLDRLVEQRNEILLSLENYCNHKRINSDLHGKLCRRNADTSPLSDVNGIEIVLGCDYFLLTAELRTFSNNEPCLFFQTYHIVRNKREYPNWSLKEISELDIVSTLNERTFFQHIHTTGISDEDVPVENDITDHFGDTYIFQLKKHMIEHFQVVHSVK
ncbi:hypothetical protein [Taibaiella soli]|uniref:Uncharacterized protein n=1 Tax=Taibaiella soli TaxID=1649169 RepID=A0A2W2ABB1_9BACT|nr:hypothetical protein [Taibaiella soli]PZF72591.1 hypothetical protein DN068_12050 [Taibaiella soli]